MKTIDIVGSQIVNGDLRFEHENPLTVSDAEAKRLHEAGVLRVEPSEAKAPAKDNAAHD